MMAKWVYAFGGGNAEGRADMKNLLGGKGANLAEMSSLGLPVPPGFTITTEVCTHFYANGKSYPKDLREQVEAALKKVETTIGAKFGDAANPLLVSVRSDVQRDTGVWLWAAADNLRVSATMAVNCAEEMVATRPRGQVQ